MTNVVVQYIWCTRIIVLTPALLTCDCEQGMVWLDAGENEKALGCFEEACTVDGANAALHFCKTVALVKVRLRSPSDR